MSDMVGRVGKAILDEGRNFGALAHRLEGENSLERRLARAAIEAMREPTDPMKVAGGLKCEAIMFEGAGSGVIFNDMREVFTAMVDTALKGETE